MNSKTTKEKIRLFLKTRKKPIFIVNISEIPNLKMLSPEKLIEMYYQTGCIIQESKITAVFSFKLLKNPLKHYLQNRKLIK